MKTQTCLAGTILFLAAAVPAAAGPVETSAGRMEITEIVTGLAEPWGFGFLPDGSMLVTERDGKLLLVSEGRTEEVSGLPEIASGGQGGLLDVMIPRDFATSREVWLSWAAPVSGGGMTAAGSGRLSEDGRRLEDFQLRFRGTPASGNRHFGSRIVEAPDGSIFVTTGDRGTGPGGLEAQDPSLTHGKVIRLLRDGSPATEVAGWRPGVHSLGHRNIQGAALDGEGRLLIVEHGARGGDEVNRPEEGRNYGWPVISYGRNYNLMSIGEGTEKPGMEQPLHWWDPSIAPSGLMIHSGALVPEWRGHVFTGSLNSDFISRLDPEASAATGWAEERIAAPETGRVRDIRQGPDGAIWFLSVSDGALYRMAPAGG